MFRLDAKAKTRRALASSISSLLLSSFLSLGERQNGFKKDGAEESLVIRDSLSYLTHDRQRIRRHGERRAHVERAELASRRRERGWRARREERVGKRNSIVFGSDHGRDVARFISG